MNKTPSPLLLAAAALWLTLSVQAHDGPHAEAEAESAAVQPAQRSSAVQVLADGSLVVPKPLQHLLKLRTVIPASAPQRHRLVAEVQPRAEAAADVLAGEAGTLEAPPGGWLLPGTAVQAGQVLAWLRPAVASKDRARRQAQQAEIEQRLSIATLNADRLRLQSAVTAEGGVAPGNTYFEQTLAEEAGLKAQRAQIAAGLAARVPVRAATRGILQESPLRAGDVVPVGARLFRLHDASQLQLLARSPEPLPITSTPTARWRTQPLSFKGQQLLDGSSGWALRFDLPATDTALQAGQLVDIEVEAANAGAWPAGACQQQVDGSGLVWLHDTAEHFSSVAVAGCDRPMPQSSQQARVVTEGASLLSAYLSASR